MNKFKIVALSTMLALSSFAAHADVYDFSYSFDNINTGNGNPVVVTGSLSGNLVGNLIQNISNIQVAINGTAFNGPLIAEAFNNTTSNWDTTITPVVSTDATLNNFIFADADAANNPAAVTNLLSFANGNVFAINSNTTDANLNPIQGYEAAVATKWSLTAAVPEPETYAMLMAGLALVSAVARRRQA